MSMVRTAREVLRSTGSWTGRCIQPLGQFILHLSTHSYLLYRLERIHQAVGTDIPLVLHGTHPLSDELVKESLKHGMVKINQNRNVRLDYHRYIEENFSKVELTVLQTEGVEVYSKEIERMMMEVFGSASRA